MAIIGIYTCIADNRVVLHEGGVVCYAHITCHADTQSSMYTKRELIS